MNASALVVGPRDGAGASLVELARELGFAHVERYRGVAAAERLAGRTPLVFFLCAAVPNIASLKPTAETVRFSSNPTVRFAPLIYLANDPSVANIQQCIRMGFDDVIALPYTGGDLGARLERQVEQLHVYYQSAHYFGPDRRKGARANATTGDGQHRRIEIVRRLATGVDVLRDNDQVEV